MKNPEAVLVSAATGSIRTLSESGLMFKAMILCFLYLIFMIFYKFRNYAILV
jgi:hypothetical protein